MQVKIFMGSGKDGVTKVEKEINAWLMKHEHEVQVVNTQTALCTVADNGSGEHFQCLAITIWYTET